MCFKDIIISILSAIPIAFFLSILVRLIGSYFIDEPFWVWYLISYVIVIVFLTYASFSSVKSECETKIAANKRESEAIIDKIRKEYEKEYETKLRSMQIDYQAKIRDFDRETRSKRSQYEEEHKKRELDLKDKILEYETIKKNLEKEFRVKECRLSKIESDLENKLANRFPFKYSATMYADAYSRIFDKASDFLSFKKPPAKTTAIQVKTEYKKKYKEAESRYKEMLYKYEFLLNVFPELRKYVDDEVDLETLSDITSYDDFAEQRDRAIDYLSTDEWNNLSPTEKYQRALDNWKKTNKSELVIGFLYEMYVAYLFRTDKYKVVDYGIKKGINDLGRDIIAYKDDKVFIIQCKNWSKDKVIHENVVCQTYGTAKEYEFSHLCSNVVPVLYVTTELSQTARRFATILGVKVKVIPLGNFPLIKCNVNENDKIYHLPFDQQYWRTEIKDDGEFYAWTVEEAEKAGFRRAFRFNFN